MVVRNIFIGVDGGATSCKVRVEDEAGSLLGNATTGPASIRLSVENTWRAILDGIKISLQKADLSLHDSSLRFHLGLGLAGCEIPKACEKFRAETPNYFAETCLRSDAYVACLGAHAGKDGAIIIVGTGVVCLQICGSETSQVGGWGFPHGDEGSGAWLGLEAVRLTLQWQDGRVVTQSTALFEDVLRHFSNDVTQLVVWANNAKSNDFAKIAPLVIHQIERGDEVAFSLIKRAAQEIDRIGAALDRCAASSLSGSDALQVGTQLPVALFGSIAPFVRPWLNKEFQIRLIEPLYDATVGAILLLNKSRGSY